MKRMNIKAAIWDLDGTLLNTLDDLAASTNAALAANGLPTHTTDEVRMFVGNGIGQADRSAPCRTGGKTRNFRRSTMRLSRITARTAATTQSPTTGFCRAGRIGRAGRKAGDCFQQD